MEQIKFYVHVKSDMLSYDDITNVCYSYSDALAIVRDFTKNEKVLCVWINEEFFATTSANALAAFILAINGKDELWENPKITEEEHVWLSCCDSYEEAYELALMYQETKPLCYKQEKA